MSDKKYMNKIKHVLSEFTVSERIFSAIYLLGFSSYSYSQYLQKYYNTGFLSGGEYSGQSLLFGIIGALLMFFLPIYFFWVFTRSVRIKQQKSILFLLFILIALMHYLHLFFGLPFYNIFL